MSEETKPYWCERCAACTEKEAEDNCDGTGFEDDPVIPNCRLWCNPNDDEKKP